MCGCVGSFPLISRSELDSSDPPRLIFFHRHPKTTARPPLRLPTPPPTPHQIGMLVVKIGGPAYRIGMGGGAASSVPSGSNSADLDFNAVQRGDAEMAQKLWRVVR